MMSIIDKYTLKPSLNETFDGIIWRIETDETEPVVAIETRNISDKITRYSAFNFSSGERLFREITVEDSWFWSLDRADNGMVFLHSYIHESNPEHKGIIAINKTGKIAWQQFNKSLYEISDKGLIVYNPKVQPKIFELISPLSGAMLSSNIQGYQPLPRSIIVPEILSDLSHVEHLLPPNISGPVFYTHFQEKDILVYHTAAENLFKQQLAVYQNGDKILEDNLATDIQKLNPEAFFIHREHLFCIRNNKQQLVSYLL